MPKLDTKRLLGFADLGVGRDTGFRDETVASRVGAKVGGGGEQNAPLLRNDTAGARIGAKISVEPRNTEH